MLRSVGLACLVTLLAMNSAFAQQGLIDSTIGGLVKLFGDSSESFEDAAKEFQQADFTAFRGRDADLVRRELTNLEASMPRVIAGTAILVGELRRFAEEGKAGFADPEVAEAKWNRILERVRGLRDGVNGVLRALNQSDHVQVVLSDRVLDMIRVTKGSRGVMLDELAALPTPTTAAEFDALIELSNRFEILMLRSEDLRLSVETAMLRVST